MARADVVGDAALLVESERAVDAGSRDAAIHQGVDLIFHQCDERRNDDRQAWHRERGRLKAERLAAAGWQHDQRIAAVKNGAHRLGLERAKVVESPEAAKNLSKLVHSIPASASLT